MRSTGACALLLAALLACGGDEPDADGGTAADTTAGADGAAPGGAAAEGDEASTTIEGQGGTAAATVEATGAPAPPGGYAVDSRPAEAGQLAKIEYASPSTVAEVAGFYDGQIDSPRRVEVDVAGDNVVAYALSPSTTMTAATTAQDIERLLDQRSEALVVVSPWQMQRNDPLIRDLRSAGLADQADQLLQTKSKITVVYAVQ